MSHGRRKAELTGVSTLNKSFGSPGLSDIVSTLTSRQAVEEGPADFVNFRLDGDRVDVVLPPGLLDRVERHADRLLAAGRALKQGILLHGAPGTGKTLTVNYLVGQMAYRTVILTTWRGMGMTRQVASMARSLAPSMVVLEDVDLIAEHWGQPFPPTGPLLFELLNEMDGLRNDCDVIFALTTNRPDILEPALAARPGRIDLAVELPLPDADGRRRLFELYARGLELAGTDLGDIVRRTDGVSPAYVKELLRKAALLAAFHPWVPTKPTGFVGTIDGGDVGSQPSWFPPTRRPVVGSRIRRSLCGRLKSNRPLSEPARASNEPPPIRPSFQLSSMNRTAEL